MKTACFIPIKSHSERVPGKNLRLLNGKKLYEYICEHALKANVFDDIFIDTNSDEIISYAKTKGIRIIIRKPELALNTANGNDLLMHHFELYPDYDYYFQLFATAPFMTDKTIVACYDKLINCTEFDSCFTAISNHGFYWFNNLPLNYRPEVLPRSQDLQTVIEETTGLYGISNVALKKYKCRIGQNPYIHFVNKYEAVDINTEEDFNVAEFIGKYRCNDVNKFDRIDIPGGGGYYLDLVYSRRSISLLRNVG